MVVSTLVVTSNPTILVGSRLPALKTAKTIPTTTVLMTIVIMPAMKPTRILMSIRRPRVIQNAPDVKDHERLIDSTGPACSKTAHIGA